MPNQWYFHINNSALIGISNASFEGEQRKFALGFLTNSLTDYLNYTFLLVGLFGNLILIGTTTLNTVKLASTNPIILRYYLSLVHTLHVASFP